MGDFDSANLLRDWNAVLSVGGSLTFSCQGITPAPTGIWGQRTMGFEVMEEQLRNERRYTIFTTTTQIPTTPTLRSIIVRAGITYYVEGPVRTDAEGCGIEIDVKQVL